MNPREHAKFICQPSARNTTWPMNPQWKCKCRMPAKCTKHYFAYRSPVKIGNCVCQSARNALLLKMQKSYGSKLLERCFASESDQNVNIVCQQSVRNGTLRNYPKWKFKIRVPARNETSRQIRDGNANVVCQQSGFENFLTICCFSNRCRSRSSRHKSQYTL